MSDSIGIQAALGLIKTVVCIYDVVTLPFYFVGQQPWTVKEKSKKQRSRQIRPDDPHSPWITVGNPPDLFYKDCKTVDELVSRAIHQFKNKKSLGTRQCFGEEEEVQPDGKKFKKLILGDYQWLTYNQVDEQLNTIGKGLLSNGIKPGDAVMIFADTRAEWFLSAQALFRFGCSIATLYATLGEDGIVHGINEAEVTHIITTQELLPKLRKVSDRIPRLNTIIYMEGIKRETPQPVGHMKLVPFNKIREDGKSAGSNIRPQRAQPDQIAVLMYTSGSTGTPKGVMITHRNLLAATYALSSIIEHLDPEKDSYMGFLPLAHVFEMAAEMLFFSNGMHVGYSSALTMTDKSTAIKKGQRGDAAVLKPTIICAVPLILDRIRKAVSDQVEARGPFMKRFFNFLVAYKNFWTRKGFGTPITNLVICSKPKALLGGKVRFVCSGGAPLSPETNEFIKSVLDVDLIQGYGLTETTASATLGDPNDLTVGNAGQLIHGVQIKFVDWDEGGYRATDKPNPRGEIVIGGPTVSAGYLNLPQQTEDSFKVEDGVRWFYTGDIGEMRSDGVLKIIDRKKDLVKLQTGEYVSLGKVEAELKSSSIVDNICVYGNPHYNYIVALVVPRRQVLCNLPEASGLDFKAACRDQKVIAAVLKNLQDHARKAGLHKTETPEKVTLVPEEWTPESGHVTAAMKVKRKFIEDFYKQEITSMLGIQNTIPRSL